MAHIVLYASGTLGDHLPFVALGQALSKRGHSVQMVINQAMHGYAHRAGLEAIALTDAERGPEEAREHAWAWNHWNHPQMPLAANSRPQALERYVTQARELIALCEDADLFIATSIRSLGYVTHAVLGLPWLTVSLNPFTFWLPATPPERQVQFEARLAEYDRHKALFAEVMPRLGVDHALPPFCRGWLFAPHVLLGSSTHFSQPDVEQLQPHNSLDLTGFWFYQEPDWVSWQPPEDLRRFCERHPLVLSFSSQPLEDPRAALALHVRAAARFQMPLLVQRGWANFSESDLPEDCAASDVLFADFLPHDWLFAQAACAIQHGGIGSIARALRQGCPVLIEPYGNDQLYNADRVGQLGVGAAVHPFKTTAEGLVRVLQEQVLTPGCRERAEAVGAAIRAEDGLGTACRAIETYMERVRSGAEASASWPAPLLVNPAAPPLDAVSVEHPITPKNREESRAEIPHILHQTWKDANVPSQFVGYQQSWQEHHPGWRYYLWTDADNREFLRRHYPWFLPIYDNYPAPIMRADAARYFVLHHFGGVYADLDAECLRPLDSLLEGKEIVFGLEPEQHLQQHRERGYTLDRIVTNAFMASTPGHPFWEHVFRAMIGFHRAPNPLDATGPFLITRAVESYGRTESFAIYSASVLSPLTSERPWHELPPEERNRLAGNAYVLHHWAGTWWRPSTARQTEQAELALLVRGSLVSQGIMRIDISAAQLRQEIALPRISCLMITANRTRLAQRAVHCFRQQTYANKELVIVDDGEDDKLEQWVHELHDPQLVMVRLPSEGKTLGELRNLAVERASGTYVAQWDDDDLSDPKRLEVQMAALYVSKADACVLQREILWWSESRRLAVSGGRPWEGSLLCHRARLPHYQEIAHGEDTPVVEQLLARERVVLLDSPGLYVYVFHGDNTFTKDHWEKLWQAATERYEDDLYDFMLLQLQDRLQIDLQAPDDTVGGRRESMLAKPQDGGSGGGVQVTLTETPAGGSLVMAAEEDRAWDGHTVSDHPRVLILIPVKDAARFLPSLWQKLCALTFPHDRLSLALLESDSADGTYEAITQSLPTLCAQFPQVTLFKRDYAYHLTGPRWEASEQWRRRAILAKSRNYLLARALTDEDWVFWIDADVARWPNDVIERLLATGKDIVVPNCLQVSTGRTFDYNTFKLKPDAENLDWSLYILNGILLPPHGFGRYYLSDLRQHDLVQVDAVGGTMLLIRADIHREGLIFPTVPYKYYIETEGLAVLAKDMGYRSWGLPNLEIWHP